MLSWDGLNFPGFWYDIDSNSFSEKLEIINISGRNIPKGYLRYNITGVKTSLAVAGIKGSEQYGLNASFMIFGMGTEKYAAIKGKSGELSKILIEHTSSVYDKKTIAQGEVWELGEGYNLTLRSLEVRGDPRKALLSLSHNGAVLKETWVPSGGIFSYSDNVSSGEINIPKFFTYLDAVLVGCCFDFAQLRYTFLTSDNITRIQKGDRIGVFRIIDVKPDFISMESDMAIYLRPGSHLNLIGNLSFRVADANELRFYPSNTRGQEISEEIEEVPGFETPVYQSLNISEAQSLACSAGAIPVEEWNKTFGGPGLEEAYSVAQTTDGGYILAGRTFRYGIDEVLLIKTDVHGNVQWDRVFQVKGSAEAWSVQQTTDGGYIIAGKAWSRGRTWYGINSLTFDAWLIKTDMNGNQQWKKTFGETKDYSESISTVSGHFTAQQTSDGGYILAGSMFWDGENRNPVWLIKADADGNQQWKKKLGLGWIKSVQQTSDSGYILAGQTLSDNDANGKAWLIKTDTNGNEQWNSTLVRSFNGIINSIQQIKDGGYILAGTGYTGSYNVSDSDAWLIKVGGETNGTANAPVENINESFSPRPTRTLTAVPSATERLPAEKVAGFEVFQTIIMLLAVYIAGQKRMK